MTFNTELRSFHTQVGISIQTLPQGAQPVRSLTSTLSQTPIVTKIPQDRLFFRGVNRPTRYFDISNIRSESLRNEAAKQWAFALRALDPIFPDPRAERAVKSDSYSELLGYDHTAPSGNLGPFTGRPWRRPNIEEFNQRVNGLVGFFLDRIVNAQHYDFIIQPGGGGLLPQVPQDIPIRLEIPFGFFTRKNLAGIDLQRLWLEERQSADASQCGPVNLEGTQLTRANLKGAWILNPRQDASTDLRNIETDGWTQGMTL